MCHDTWLSLLNFIHFEKIELCVCVCVTMVYRCPEARECIESHQLELWVGMNCLLWVLGTKPGSVLSITEPAPQSLRDLNVLTEYGLLLFKILQKKKKSLLKKVNTTKSCSHCLYFETEDPST